MIKDSLRITPKITLSAASSMMEETPPCYIVTYNVNLTDQTIVHGSSAFLKIYYDDGFTEGGVNLYSCDGDNDCFPTGSASGTFFSRHRIGSIQVEGLSHFRTCTRLEHPLAGDLQTFIVTDLDNQLFEGQISVQYNPEREIPLFAVPDNILYASLTGFGSAAPPLRLYTLIDGELDSTRAEWNVGNPFQTSEIFAAMLPGEWKDTVAKASFITACGESLTVFSYITLMKAPDAQFTMDVSARDIDYLDTTVIRLQAFDENNEATGYPMDAEFTITADPGVFGHFEHSNIFGGVGRAVEGGREARMQSRRNGRASRSSITGDSSMPSLTFTYAEAIGGGIYFIADGKFPVTSKGVRFTVTRSLDQQPIALDSVTVFPLCHTVVVTPSELNPGDTAEVNIFMTLKDGRTRPFPNGTIFNFNLQQDGSIKNRLLYHDVLDDHFTTVTELPLYFIADTVVSTLVNFSTIVGLPIDNTIPIPTSVEVSEKRKSKGKKTQNDNSCDLGTKVIIEDVQLQVVQVPSGIIQITNTDPPTMPVDRFIQAQLKGYKHGSYTMDASIEVWWRTKENHGKSHRSTSYTYTCTKVEGSNSNIIKIPINWGANNGVVRGGDSVVVVLSAKTEKGHMFSKTLMKPFDILGTNPAKTVVRDKIKSLVGNERIGDYSLSVVLQAICHHESQGTYQFNPSDRMHQKNMYPVFGDPQGYGLMMNDPSTDDMVWNWVANIYEGLSRFNEKSKYSKNYNTYLKTGNIDGSGNRLHPLSSHQIRNHWYETFDDKTKEYKSLSYNNVPPLTGKQLLLDILQVYNSGAYYQWDPEGEKGNGAWKASPPKDKNGKVYADIVFNWIDKISNNQTDQIPDWE